jgi:dihydroflavonol-4-reductase
MARHGGRDNATGSVLVTGINGYLGGHVVVQLLRRGYRVHGTVRSIARSRDIARCLCETAGAAPDRLRLFEADLGGDDGWQAAASGCRFVVHTASPFPLRQPRRDDELVRPAREGALRVLEAARSARAERVVMTSSVAAISYGHGRPPFTEQDWTDAAHPRTTPYQRSKTLAEQAAWRHAREHGMELAVVNPGLILGPLLHPQVGTSVEIVRALLAGELPGLPDIAFAISDVRDTADAHLRAMLRPAAAGERFIVAGRSLSVSDLADALAVACPERAGRLPQRKLPDWLVRFAALFDPKLRGVVGELGFDSRVSHDKARGLLGWQPRDVAETIRDTARSLIAFGIVQG